MLARINDDGDLVIKPTDSTSRYTLKKFEEDWDNGRGAILFETETVKKINKTKKTK